MLETLKAELEHVMINAGWMNCEIKNVFICIKLGNLVYYSEGIV